MHYLENLGIPFIRQFVLTYSITDRNSFEVEVPRLHGYINTLKSRDKCIPSANFMLVGMKCDLEHDRVVTKAEGEKMAQKLGCFSFLEMSTTNEINFDLFFVH